MWYKKPNNRRGIKPKQTHTEKPNQKHSLESGSDSARNLSLKP